MLHAIRLATAIRDGAQDACRSRWPPSCRTMPDRLDLLPAGPRCQRCGWAERPGRRLPRCGMGRRRRGAPPLRVRRARGHRRACRGTRFSGAPSGPPSARRSPTERARG
jgi:hypothetical protein